MFLNKFNMLVKELIEELKKFPEDADIIVTTKYKGYKAISSVVAMRTVEPEKNNAETICPVLIF